MENRLKQKQFPRSSPRALHLGKKLHSATTKVLEYQFGQRHVDESISPQKSRVHVFWVKLKLHQTVNSIVKASIYKQNIKQINTTVVADEFI